MTISRHAYKRAKERLGWSKESLDRMGERILTEGIVHKDAKTPLRKWMTKQYMREKNASGMVVFSGALFIFKGDILTTMYSIPGNLRKYSDR